MSAPDDWMDANDMLRAGMPLDHTDGDVIEIPKRAQAGRANGHGSEPSNDNGAADSGSNHRASTASAANGAEPTPDNKAVDPPRGHEAVKDEPAKPTIYLRLGERDQALSEAVTILAGNPRIYQRGANLVRCITEAQPDAPALAKLGARIELWIPTALDAELDRTISFARMVIKEEQFVEQSADAPAWLAKRIVSLKAWPGVRPLTTISATPVIDSDANIISTPGYHPSTGVLYSPLQSDLAVQVPDHPTANDIKIARKVLEDVVSDFPFVLPAHRSGWVAYLLTLVARYSFVGPSPMFWFDASTAGAGKGLLEWCASRTALGVAPYKGNWPVSDESEQRKVITTIAISGPRVAVFDNLKRGALLGGSVLCQLLTQDTWSDRILSTNTSYHGAWNTTLACTGNNITLDDDMHRRVVHIRLEPSMERPEERDPSTFRHPHLERYVLEHQGELLGAALTILRGYHVAGRPAVPLATWHSYDGWTAAIRAPIVWSGLTDPAEALKPLRESGTTPDAVNARLLDSLHQVTKLCRFSNDEFKAARLHEVLYERFADRQQFVHAGEVFADLRAAIAEVREVRGGGEPSVKALGKTLAELRTRVLSVESDNPPSTVRYQLRSRIRAGHMFWHVEVLS